MAISDDNLGFLYIFLASFLWATIAVVGKVAVTMGDSITIIVFRIGMAFLLLTAIILIRGNSVRVSKKDFLLLSAMGLFSCSLFHICYFLALERITASMTVVLLYVSPLFVLIFSALFLSERITNIKILSIFLTLSGCFLVAEAFDAAILQLNLTGIMLALGAALCYSIFTLLSKYMLKSYDPLVVIWYYIGFGLLFLLFVRPPWILPEMAASFSSHLWLAILYLAIFPTLFAYILYISGLRLLEASRASLLATTEPVISVVLAFLFLGEVMSPLQLLGGLAILIAIILLRMEKGLSDKKKIKYNSSKEEEPSLPGTRP